MGHGEVAAFLEAVSGRARSKHARACCCLHIARAPAHMCMPQCASPRRPPAAACAVQHGATKQKGAVLVPEHVPKVRGVM